MKLLPVGKALIPDFDKVDAGILKYIGRKFDTEQRGYVPSEVPEEIDSKSQYAMEYIRAVKRNDLAPADKETADMCGVAFVQPEAKKGNK